jgi:hypothetical protein
MRPAPEARFLSRHLHGPSLLVGVSRTALASAAVRDWEGMRQRLCQYLQRAQGWLLVSTGKPAACHAAQPPTKARALCQPAARSSRATRALVASSFQAQ